jgi:hypothetical protein
MRAIPDGWQFGRIKRVELEVVGVALQQERHSDEFSGRWRVDSWVGWYLAPATETRISGYFPWMRFR